MIKIMQEHDIYPPKYFRHEKEMSKAERKKLMAYYTPMPVVDFMLRSIEEILRDKFELDNGFANENIKFLDFAAGTGIFICEAIEKAFKENLLLDNIYKILQENFYAFEYDKSTYEICLENISEIFNRYGYSFDPKNIHNINTLSNEASNIFRFESDKNI